MGAGSLTVVGTGITFRHQATSEAIEAIRRADKVLFSVPDGLAAAWIASLNGSAESLDREVRPDEIRRDVYREITDTLLTRVRAGEAVCAVFYGHPGVLVRATHDAIRICRAEGYPASMLPGVSAEDCLIADLGIDPGATGCVSIDATAFLLYRVVPMPAMALILWQVGVVGNATYRSGAAAGALRLLTDRLVDAYGADHVVWFYEASQYGIDAPMGQPVPLASLADQPLGPRSTLYVPPSDFPEPDLATLDALGLPAAFHHDAYREDGSQPAR